MEKHSIKSLEFHGKEIHYVVSNGINYVVVSSVCKALGLDSEWHVRAISDDEILGSERCVHTGQIPGDDQTRKFVCLPEEYVYGWLFGIKMTNTMSDETKTNLTAYKHECYHVLFNHFHGKILEANQQLKRKAELQQKLRVLHARLLENSEYQELMAVKYDLKILGSPYQQAQKEQLKIFNEELNLN